MGFALFINLPVVGKYFLVFRLLKIIIRSIRCFVHLDLSSLLTDKVRYRFPFEWILIINHLKFQLFEPLNVIEEFFSLIFVDIVIKSYPVAPEAGSFVEELPYFYIVKELVFIYLLFCKADDEAELADV